MAVTTADFAELKRLRRPQLLTFAALAGISKRSAAATRTDDALRLKILEARVARAERATTLADVLVDHGIAVDDLLAAEIGRNAREQGFAVAYRVDTSTGAEVTIHLPLPEPGGSAEG